MLRLDLFRKLEKHRGCVNTVSFSEDGDILVSGSDDRRVIFWEWETGHVKLSFHSGHYDNVFQAKIMPYTEDRTIVTCAADGQVMCFLELVKDSVTSLTAALYLVIGSLWKLSMVRSVIRKYQVDRLTVFNVLKSKIKEKGKLFLPSEHLEICVWKMNIVIIRYMLPLVEAFLAQEFLPVKGFHSYLWCF